MLRHRHDHVVKVAVDGGNGAAAAESAEGSWSLGVSRPIRGFTGVDQIS